MHSIMVLCAVCVQAAQEDVMEIWLCRECLCTDPVCTVNVWYAREFSVVSFRQPTATATTTTTTTRPPTTATVCMVGWCMFVVHACTQTYNGITHRYLCYGIESQIGFVHAPSNWRGERARARASATRGRKLRPHPARAFT